MSQQPSQSPADLLSALPRRTSLAAEAASPSLKHKKHKGLTEAVKEVRQSSRSPPAPRSLARGAHHCRRRGATGCRSSRARAPARSSSRPCRPLQRANGSCQRRSTWGAAKPGLRASEAPGDVRLVVEHRENHGRCRATISEPISTSMHPGVARLGKPGIWPRRRKALTRFDPAFRLANRLSEVRTRLEALKPPVVLPKRANMRQRRRRKNYAADGLSGRRARRSAASSASHCARRRSRSAP
jgi:hypothetical protein